VEVLITGGTGLVGHHLVPALIERGDNVSVLTLPSEDAGWLDELGVTVWRGDICDPDSLVMAMRGVHTVFHLAALQGHWVSMDEYYKVNVTGTENVCRAALSAGVGRIVHVSSWTIYGLSRGWTVGEEAAASPGNDPYWISKAQGDLLVQRMIAQDQLPAVIVRPGTIFGVGDLLNFGRVAEKVRDRKAIIIGSGRNALPLVYATDVVQGLLLCADDDRAEGRVFNITNDEPLTQGQLLGAIAEELDVSPPRVHVPYRVACGGALAAEQAVKLTRAKHPFVTRHGVGLYGTDNRHSIARARKELGYDPRVSVRQGVHLACAWYEREYLSKEPELEGPNHDATLTQAVEPRLVASPSQ
jgi:nucleoside-diphosphate-sugar epimerase